MPAALQLMLPTQNGMCSNCVHAKQVVQCWLQQELLSSLSDIYEVASFSFAVAALAQYQLHVDW